MSPQLSNNNNNSHLPNPSLLRSKHLLVLLPLRNRNLNN